MSSRSLIFYYTNNITYTANKYGTPGAIAPTIQALGTTTVSPQTTNSHKVSAQSPQSQPSPKSGAPTPRTVLIFLCVIICVISSWILHRNIVR